MLCNTRRMRNVNGQHDFTLQLTTNATAFSIKQTLRMTTTMLLTTLATTTTSLIRNALGAVAFQVFVCSRFVSALRHKKLFVFSFCFLRRIANKLQAAVVVAVAAAAADRVKGKGKWCRQSNCWLGGGGGV